VSGRVGGGGGGGRRQWVRVGESKGTQLLGVVVGMVVAGAEVT